MGNDTRNINLKENDMQNVVIEIDGVRHKLIRDEKQCGTCGVCSLYKECGNAFLCKLIGEKNRVDFYVRDDENITIPKDRYLQLLQYEKEYKQRMAMTESLMRNELEERRIKANLS